nr:hypothetical protein [Streptomyces sp. TLI_235]
MPEPLDSLSMLACSMQVWPLPESGRWLALTVGQADTEFPLELIAVVGAADLSASPYQRY